MPTHENHCQVIIRDQDGNQIQIDHMPQIFDGNLYSSLDAEVFHEMGIGEISFSFRPPSEVRKRLSRKRLKKVLMSRGVSRNVSELVSHRAVRTMTMDTRKMFILGLLLMLWDTDEDVWP